MTQVEIIERLNKEQRRLLENMEGKPSAPLQQWNWEDILSGLCLPLGIPFAPITKESVDFETYRKYQDICFKYSFVPIFHHEVMMVIACLEPWSDSYLREVRREIGMEVIPVGTTMIELDRTFSLLEKAVIDTERAEAAEAQRSEKEDVDQTQLSILSGWDITRDHFELAKTIIGRAQALGASDVHLESYPEKLNVRFRINGTLETLPPIEKRYKRSVIEAVRILANFSSEDVGFVSGRAEIQVGPEHTVDLRVENQPTPHGDSIVIRLLDPKNITRFFGTLPFSGKNLEIVQHSLSRSNGLMLLTGPTGSGKTTTLYRCLLSIDCKRLSVRTIEDPIEYTLPNIIQTEIIRGSVTFPSALRSMMRADPDVILVGEIRDEETLDTAVRAALTGHLLLSTLHTNDAIGAILRLMDLGAEALTIRSTLNLVVAQRLVPKLCDVCKQEVKTPSAVKHHFEYHKMLAPESVFEPGGCPACNHTGTQGRMPIFEMFYPDDETRDFIRERMEEAELRKLWKEKGGETLVEDGLRLVAAGQAAYVNVRGFETSILK